MNDDVVYVLDLPHNARTYAEGLCRCELCTAAHSERQKAANASRGARLKKDPTLAPHGKLSTYTNWECRCELCKYANSVYQAKVRADRAIASVAS